jgi:hypothetical protein
MNPTPLRPRQSARGFTLILRTGDGLGAIGVDACQVFLLASNPPPGTGRFVSCLKTPVWFD